MTAGRPAAAQGVGRRTGPRLGLGGRIRLLAGSLALILSLVLGSATYLTVRSVLLADREQVSLEQAIVDARLLVGAIASGDVNESALLTSLRPPLRSWPLLNVGGHWSTASLQIEPGDLPAALIEAVSSGDAARQRFRFGGDIVLGVGIPLTAVDGAYFEVFSLRELNATLGTLARTLVIVGSFVTLLGVAFGSWISRRVLRPLSDVSEIAGRLSAGELDARVDHQNDRDLERLAGSFNQMAEALQQRIAREARFASDVSHELRSPLTTIATTLAVLETRRDELDPSSREALELLAKEINRFQKMVGELIEIAKADAGTIDLDWQVVPVDGVARGMVRRLRIDPGTLVVDPGAESVQVRVDERVLDRAIANLVDNAQVHGGGVTRIGVGRSDGVVRIAVEDEGPGVDPEDRERVFERFARGRRNQRRGSVEGSGLGLALVRENIQRLGGTVVLEDSPRGGARFVIELPEVGP